MVACAGISAYLHVLPSSRISVRSVTRYSGEECRSGVCSKIGSNNERAFRDALLGGRDFLVGVTEAEARGTRLIQTANVSVSRVISRSFRRTSPRTGGSSNHMLPVSATGRPRHV